MKRNNVFAIFISFLATLFLLCLVMSFVTGAPTKMYFSYAYTSIAFMIIFSFEIKFAYVPNKKMINTVKAFWLSVGKPGVYKGIVIAMFILFASAGLYSLISAIVSLLR